MEGGSWTLAGVFFRAARFCKNEEFTVCDFTMTGNLLPPLSIPLLQPGQHTQEAHFSSSHSDHLHSWETHSQTSLKQTMTGQWPYWPQISQGKNIEKIVLNPQCQKDMSEIHGRPWIPFLTRSHLALTTVITEVSPWHVWHHESGHRLASDQSCSHPGATAVLDEF